ncbi:hypothetical protein Moror_9750 [Moniliophthora roreri MCA 2997]|uniref:Fruit-body specific protein a n=2 Tax=Moniliophthora roreri TaxID=221103 RepID=V2X1F9_MONRO|nr:hypothetical protein Moror_9750 [Moniliophthora roreri MCA 2997]KAI3613733.1 hypothetical protein WG66_013480 [Moniliophthora roreri]
MFSTLSLLAFAGLVVASGAGLNSRSFDLTSTTTDWTSIRTALLAKAEQQASGTALRPAVAAAALPEPPVPAGYELAFGPLNASTSALGYMGFVFVPTYNPSSCSDLCKVRDFDANGGLCQFFNIYQATVNKTASFVCAMYYLPTDNSTATNPGDATVTITESRGYRRISTIEGGTFESLTCTPPAVTCSATTSGGWVGTTDTAVIVHNTALAHFGSGAVSLGSLSGNTANAGKVTTPVLKTKAGPYVLEFFHTNTLLNPANASNTAVNVTWNGVVIDTLQGASNWTFHGYTLEAKGNDTLAFVGGKFPAYDFIDDVFLFSL